jgi:hypothetical protein
VGALGRAGKVMAHGHPRAGARHVHSGRGSGAATTPHAKKHPGSPVEGLSCAGWRSRRAFF